MKAPKGDGPGGLQPMTATPSASGMGAGLRALPAWSVAAPLLGLAAIAVTPATAAVGLAVGAVLIAAVLAAVHHAETIAHQVGEPFGTLILAVAVTVIETSLIVSMIQSAGPSEAALARDTIFAALMIVLNGIIGVCLLAGGRVHHEQSFTRDGVTNGLAMVATLATLTLVLPNYTISQPGPYYTKAQLIFVAVVSLVIYATFVVAQTVRHRDHFLYEDGRAADHPGHGERPLPKATLAATAVLLIAALIAVVLLAKALSPLITAAVAAAGAPKAVVGIIIAALVLLPEGIAAWRAARSDRLQSSLNLALGSALATIGLTIPAVTVAALLLGLDLALGLGASNTVLLVLTLFVTSLSLSTGRTTLVPGVLHLGLMATFLFTTLVP